MSVLDPADRDSKSTDSSTFVAECGLAEGFERALAGLVGNEMEGSMGDITCETRPRQERARACDDGFAVKRSTGKTREGARWCCCVRDSRVSWTILRLPFSTGTAVIYNASWSTCDSRQRKGERKTAPCGPASESTATASLQRWTCPRWCKGEIVLRWPPTRPERAISGFGSPFDRAPATPWIDMEPCVSETRPRRPRRQEQDDEHLAGVGFVNVSAADDVRDPFHHAGKGLQQEQGALFVVSRKCVVQRGFALCIHRKACTKPAGRSTVRSLLWTRSRPRT